jgi:WD40 repeat protein
VAVSWSACWVIAGDTFETLGLYEPADEPLRAPPPCVCVCQDPREGSPRAWLVRPGASGSISVIDLETFTHVGDHGASGAEASGSQPAITALLAFVTPTTWEARVAVGDAKGGLCVYDVETWNVHARLLGCTGGVQALAAFVSCTYPHHTCVASAGRDRVLRIHDADTGELRHSLKGHRHWVTCLQHYQQEGADR